MLPSEAFFVFTARTLIKVYSEKVKQLIYLNKKAPYKELLYPEPGSNRHGFPQVFETSASTNLPAGRQVPPMAF